MGVVRVCEDGEDKGIRTEGLGGGGVHASIARGGGDFERAQLMRRVVFIRISSYALGRADGKLTVHHDWVRCKIAIRNAVFNTQKRVLQPSVAAQPFLSQLRTYL